MIQKAAKRRRRHQPAVEERAEAHTKTPLAELRKDERHILVVTRDSAADAERLVQ